jgi:hypothetical protein
MRPLLLAGFAMLALATVPSVADAQAPATEALPPGGLTIGGPGAVHGTGSAKVWSSTVGVNICATVSAPATSTSGTLSVKLTPANVLLTGLASTQGTLTQCATAQTGVLVTFTGTGPVFWRVDRTN